MWGACAALFGNTCYYFSSTQGVPSVGRIQHCSFNDLHSSFLRHFKAVCCAYSLNAALIQQRVLQGFLRELLLQRGKSKIKDKLLLL